MPNRSPSCSLLTHTTTNPTGDAATAGRNWSSEVKALTTNSPPAGDPSAENTRATTPRMLWSWPWLSQAATKRPVPSAATAGRDWSSALVVLTGNSGVSGTGVAARRRRASKGSTRWAGNASDRAGRRGIFLPVGTAILRTIGRTGFRGRGTCPLRRESLRPKPIKSRLPVKRNHARPSRSAPSDRMLRRAGLARAGSLFETIGVSPNDEVPDTPRAGGADWTGAAVREIVVAVGASAATTVSDAAVVSVERRVTGVRASVPVALATAKVTIGGAVNSVSEVSVAVPRAITRSSVLIRPSRLKSNALVAEVTGFSRLARTAMTSAAVTDADVALSPVSPTRLPK